MKTITVTFYISTKYEGSKVEEDVEVEVDEDATEQEIETLLKSAT